MKYDLIVIGGGPAGLSTAVQAKKKGLTAVVLERGEIVNSIRNFPRDMIFFSRIEELEIGGVPFELSTPDTSSFGAAIFRTGSYRVKRRLRSLIRSFVRKKHAITGGARKEPGRSRLLSDSLMRAIGSLAKSATESIPSKRPTRLEAIEYYLKVARSRQIDVRCKSEVVSVRRVSDAPAQFSVEVKNVLTSETDFLLAKRIVVATGFYGTPNSLDVPGENLPNVAHYYSNPDTHLGKRVVVIGGNHSAVDAALDLCKNGVHVTLVHRGEWFSKNLKPWILPEVVRHVKSGEITTYFNCRVVQIFPERIDVLINGNPRSINCEFVYALVGYRPDLIFLRDMGIDVDQKTGVPAHNPLTFESNVPGIYIAGSLTAGYDRESVFIENGREHGKAIAESFKL
jgi:bacillithiol disulfide reductase